VTGHKRLVNSRALKNRGTGSKQSPQTYRQPAEVAGDVQLTELGETASSLAKK